MANLPTPSLDDARLRVATANDHIQSLEQNTRQFLDENRHAITIEKNRKTGKQVVRVDGAPIIPSDFGIHVGLIAHNLRSALNGLAWQLAMVSAGQHFSEHACKRLQFPIMMRGPRAKNGFDRTDNSIAPLGRFITAIERLQPYKRGAGRSKNPLWFLNTLNNTDKHRFVIRLGTSRGATVMSFTGNMLAANDRIRMAYAGNLTLYSGGIAERGAKIAEVGVIPAGVNVNVQFTPEIAFGDGCPAIEGLPVSPTLRKIAMHVGDIIEKFAPFF